MATFEVIIKNPKTSQKILPLVALNPNTPIGTLRKLLYHPYSKIKENVLKNPNLPDEYKMLYLMEK